MSKKYLAIGIVLTITFFGVLTALALPIWDGKHFMEFADNDFNMLSKGSVYFIPEVSEKAEKYVGKELKVTIKMKDGSEAEKTALLYSKAGADVKVSDNEIVISGDLGRVLQSALTDADAMYKNEGKVIYNKYGYNEREALYYWWLSLKKIEKDYKKSGNRDKIDVGIFIEKEVITRAIEPAYNYYGIEAKNISEEVILAAGLLVFYVVYTLWWGYSIYFLFEGFGLRMEKAKEKKEV